MACRFTSPRSEPFVFNLIAWSESHFSFIFSFHSEQFSDCRVKVVRLIIVYMISFLL